MERRFMNGRFIRAAAGAMTDGRFINLVQGTLSVQGGTFISNTTATSSTFSATLSVTGAGFTNNAGREGGAIYDYDSLTATDSVFTANHATQGGVVDQEWYATLTGDFSPGTRPRPVAATCTPATSCAAMATAMDGTGLPESGDRSAPW
jgi:hypothetical protein